MRVNISYGVEFDELPDILDKMINKCLDDAKIAKLKIQYLQTLIDEEDKVQLAKQIDAARQTLTRVDATLGDLANLAVGYVDAREQIRAGLESQAQATGAEPDFETEEVKVNGEYVDDQQPTV